MNVTCPKCQTVYRVDPAKVPARGVRARCAECAGVFFVGREAAPEPVPAIAIPAAVPTPTAPAPAAPGPAAPARPAYGPVGGMPAPVPAAPARPAAPPPRPAVPPQAAAAPPSAPAVEYRAPAPPMPAAPAPTAPAPAAPRRPVNPFLAQDPSTKARRLARALISDLVVYHPAKRADGLRDGTLKLLFDEEIRKCWEEYTEQVGMEMATSTPYFTEALNEILADGQPVFS